MNSLAGALCVFVNVVARIQKSCPSVPMTAVKSMELLLGNNQLTGRLPFGLILMPLTRLSLHDNYLTGPLDVVFALTHTQAFLLDHNQFTG